METNFEKVSGYGTDPYCASAREKIDVYKRQVQEQVHNLNKALRQAQFGTDKYQFRVGPNPDYLDYYNICLLYTSRCV